MTDSKEPIFFFFLSEEEYALEDLLSRIRKKEEERGSIIEVYHRAESDLCAVIDSALNIPMFSERKLVILKYQGDFLLPDSAVLFEYFQKASERTTFVVTARGPVWKSGKGEPEGIKKNILFQALRQTASSTDLLKAKARGILVLSQWKKKGKEGDIVPWLKKDLLPSRGFRIKDAAAQMFAEICGRDRMIIAQEVEKLSGFKEKGEEITIEEVKKIASDNKFFDVFALIDFLCAGNRIRAVEAMRNLIEEGESHPFILWHLDHFFARAGVVRSLIGEGVDESEALNRAGFRFYHRENLKNIKSIKQEKLLQAPRLLLEADRLMKSGFPEETILEKLVLDIT